MGILGYTILTLCVLGVLCALILYFVAQKFKVYEDPRIDDVEKMLPGANCGGCGYAGCRTFASTAVGVNGMCVRLPRQGRLRDRLQFRCAAYGPGNGTAGRGPGEMYGLRSMREEVPEDAF